MEARGGDLVCVLFGCSVPVILWDENETVKLVGEAYVHGFIDGEAIGELKSGNVEERQWDIT